MLIAVLAKQVPDTWGERRLDLTSGRIERSSTSAIDEVNEQALELALTARDSNQGSEVVVVTVGPEPARDGIRKLLAIGADRGIHVVGPDLEGADIRLTVATLVGALRNLNPDLIVAGAASTDGNSGVVPSAVATSLGLPYIGPLDDATVTKTEASGLRRRDQDAEVVHVDLPAVISVTEKNPAARFAGLRGVMGAKKKPVSVLAPSELAPLPPGPRSVIAQVVERPSRVAGHKEDASADSARRLAEYIRAEGGAR